MDKGKYSKGAKHAQLRERRECVVNLIDSFEHEGPHGKHVCMVFEALGENLLSLIKRYNYAGIPINKVKDIAKKVAEGALLLFVVEKIILPSLSMFSSTLSLSLCVCVVLFRPSCCL